MKTTFTLSCIAMATAMCIRPAGAIEAPADDTPPPAISKQHTDSELVERPYIGVVTGEIPALLGSHLQLKEGGVLVDSVMPGGPAAQAGLRSNDIITRVDGKAVASPADLNRAITSLRPGDKVRIDYIHEGRNEQLELTLASRNERIARQDRQTLDQLEMRGVPDHMTQRMRDMIERNLGQFDMPEGDLDAWLQGSPLARRLQEMRRLMEQPELPQHEGRQGLPDEIRFEQNSTIRMLDNEGSIEIQSSNGIQNLTVRDRNNHVVWEGPWTTEADKAAAPDDIRKRVEGLQIESFNGNGLRLRMGR